MCGLVQGKNKKCSKTEITKISKKLSHISSIAQFRRQWWHYDLTVLNMEVLDNDMFDVGVPNMGVPIHASTLNCGSEVSYYGHSAVVAIWSIREGERQQKKEEGGSISPSTRYDQDKLDSYGSLPCGR